MTSETRQGGCLCGAVRFRCDLSDTGLQACHCAQCQKWTGGGPLISVHVDSVTIEDESQISRYHASDWGERCFCGTCGSTLFWKMQGKPIHYLAVGLFDDQSGFTMTEEIFVDRRACWLPAWPDAGQSTEAQEYAKLKTYLEGETS